MEYYIVIKTRDVLTSAILFGTGIGIAFFMFQSWRTQNIHEKFYAARNTVLADYLSTFPAAAIQPVSGAVLIYMAGFTWSSTWLMEFLVTYLANCRKKLTAYAIISFGRTQRYEGTLNEISRLV